MQDHLHVGRRTWQRMARTWGILIAGIALPYLLGLHWRNFVGRNESSGQRWVQYGGFGPTEYYAYGNGPKPPLYILVPLGFRQSNIHGMTHLDKRPYTQR
jgi:hypothetical protein